MLQCFYLFLHIKLQSIVFSIKIKLTEKLPKQKKKSPYIPTKGRYYPTVKYFHSNNNSQPIPAVIIPFQTQNLYTQGSRKADTEK